MFYKYDFEENIDKLQIENLDSDQLSVEISIKPRASAFVERKMFTTEHIVQLLTKKGYKIEQVIYASSSMRNFSTDPLKTSGIWIFKLKVEDRRRNKRKEEDVNIENVFDPKAISTENSTVEPTITEEFKIIKKEKK